MIWTKVILSASKFYLAGMYIKGKGNKRVSAGVVLRGKTKVKLKSAQWDSNPLNYTGT